MISWFGGASRANIDALAFLFASENAKGSLLLWTLQALAANTFAKQLGRAHPQVEVKMTRTLHSLGATLLAPAAAAVVSVSFPQAERYTDAERGAEAERVRQALAQALTALGGSLLPAAQSLEVQVLDIDLAGERRPLRRAGADARVMRGTVDWPRIRLHFTWREGDRVLADEVADIADMDYLRQPQAGMSTSALPYERRMLDDWFHRRFAAPPAAH